MSETSKPDAAEAPERPAAGRQGGGAKGARSGLDFVLDVPLRVTVEIGSTRMLVAEVLQLDKGSVVELDRLAGEPADVLVNGRLVGRGEVTMVEDRLAVRLLEIDGGAPNRGDA
jgi:flagellar motor switch protein FliN/FliY